MSSALGSISHGAPDLDWVRTPPARAALQRARGWASLLVASAVLAMHAPVARTQETAVELTPGARVRVMLATRPASSPGSVADSSPRLDGSVFSVTADTLALTIARNAPPVQLAAADIRELWVNVGSGDRRLSWMIWIGAVGALIWRDKNLGERPQVGAAIGLAVGALLPYPDHWQPGIFPRTARPLPPQRP